jgi:hypothetical protein
MSKSGSGGSSARALRRSPAHCAARRHPRGSSAHRASRHAGLPHVAPLSGGRTGLPRRCAARRRPGRSPQRCAAHCLEELSRPATVDLKRQVALRTRSTEQTNILRRDAFQEHCSCRDIIEEDHPCKLLHCLASNSE